MPFITHLPVPALVKLLTPALLANTGVMVLSLELVPVSVRVRAALPPSPNGSVLVNTKAPVPDASTVAPLSPRVNKRSVLVAAPVYLSVPPLITKLAAALLDWPMLLATPPSAKLDTDNVPPSTEVTPV